MKKSILLTGGCGYIGSHTLLQFLDHFYNIQDISLYDIVIVDNLVNSNLENLIAIQKEYEHPIHVYSYSLQDMQLFEIFQKHSIHTVIHFAGLKSVGESNENPLLYYQNNLQSTLHLLQTMKDFNCKNIIFSSSATVYGNPQYIPLDESHPLSTLNPYGTTKFMIEQILEDISKTKQNWNIILLRYFNPISCHPSGIIGENPVGRPNNIFPILSRVYQGIYKNFTVFGNDYETKDGTGIRDYIHVVDLAEAHIKAFQSIENNQDTNIWKIYNVGTGEGYSVMDLIEMFEKKGEKKIKYEIHARRQGDSAICYANAEKIEKELGWKAKYNLEEMVEHEIYRIKKICEKK
jgi:UDP-glucose 4-epimerase